MITRHSNDIPQNLLDMHDNVYIYYRNIKMTYMSHIQTWIHLLQCQCKSGASKYHIFHIATIQPHKVHRYPVHHLHRNTAAHTLITVDASNVLLTSLSEIEGIVKCCDIVFFLFVEWSLCFSCSALGAGLLRVTKSVVR